jgi:predicted AAA+ superfamily ATPase
MHYISRAIESTLLKYLKIFPVIGLTGPRQSGKSTLLKHLLSENYRYVTFDNQSIVDAFYADPNQFMKQYSNNIIPIIKISENEL